MNDITFLTYKQVFSDNKLNIFKNFLFKTAAITDFSILLGGYVSKQYITDEGQQKAFFSNNDFINLRKERTGYWWLSDSSPIRPEELKELYQPCNIADYGGEGYSRDYSPLEYLHIGCRPVVPYSSISLSCVNKRKILQLESEEVEYGEYPQYVAPADISVKLENAYNNNMLILTGKIYSNDYFDYDGVVVQKKYIEYEYNEKKYIRFIANCSRTENTYLSSGQQIKEGMPYWIEVEPIKWLIDEENNVALSKKILFAGVPFDKCDIHELCLKRFELTYIKEFLVKSFLRDIIPSRVSDDIESTKNTEELLKEMKLLREELKTINEKANLLEEENKKLKTKIRKINEFINK